MNSWKKIIVLFCLLMHTLSINSAKAEQATIEIQIHEPALYDHFAVMQQTQERLYQRSPEEQERLQPKVREAELRACQRLREDRLTGVGDDHYRQQGGEEFIAYVLQFEKYCETLQ